MSIGELSADDLQDLVGRELDGRYRLDKYIDRGGFGAVYMGVDKKFNQAVAVKVGLSYREFMKEAKLAAEVRHDHIVQVSDYGNDKGLAYLVMEFLHGDDLEKIFLTQGNQLTRDQLRKFVAEVGDALAHAHADNLIHRDLKPRNIILKQNLSKVGSTSTISKFVLLDFGIAAKLDAEGTQRNRTQDGAGTVEYMAPELLKPKPITTPQSDIYAFGVILFQMMAGRVPFPQMESSRLAMADCVNAICHAKPPRFAEVAPDRTYPPAVEELVQQCLEKDPARRPQTMAEVGERFLASYPALIPAPPGDSNRHQGDETDSGSKRDRHRAPLWPSIVAVLAMSGVVAFAVQQWQTGPPTYRPSPTLTLAHGNKVETLKDGQTVQLMAGSTVELTFMIDGLPGDAKPEFELLGVPQGMTFEMTDGSVPRISRSFALSAPLNAPPVAAQTITFRATIPGWSTPIENQMKLEIRRPSPWLPKHAGFAMASGAKLRNINDTVFATTIERRIANQSVRFRLVPGVLIGDRQIRTFYVMEQLVSNALFDAFAREMPDFEVQPREEKDREWKEADEYPVTNVSVLEAQQFARWLAGPYGSLPTVAEWDLSSGYYDFRRVVRERFGKRIDQITSTELRSYSGQKEMINEVEVWIGMGPARCEFRAQDERFPKERSPYGCQYNRLSMGGSRTTELTATLTDLGGQDRSLRDVSLTGKPGDDLETLSVYHAKLRGLGRPNPADDFLWVESVDDESPIRDEEALDDLAGIVGLVPGRNGTDATEWFIGFRIVVLTDVDPK